MSIYGVSPEEDLAFKKKNGAMPLFDSLLPRSSAIALDRSGAGGIDVKKFGFGDFGLTEAPDHILPEYEIAKTMSNYGSNIFDPTHPLYRNPNLSGSGSGNIDGLLSRLFSSNGLPGSGSALPGVGSLGSKAIRFSDLYKPSGTNLSDKYFDDLLGQISTSGQSSIDAVTKSLESEQLQQLLGEIDKDTAGQVSSIKMDALDRGIGGPGQVSDIESNAVAQAMSGGGRTKAAARTQYSLADLARQKAAEQERAKALQTAYGSRYAAGVSREQDQNRISAQGAMTEAQMLNELLGTEYKGGITTGEGAADRGSRESMNMLNQYLDANLKTRQMTQQDRQFYDNLQAEIEQAALGRTADYNRTLLGRQSESSFADQLFENAFSGLVGSVSGGIGSAASDYLTGSAKKKKYSDDAYEY